KNFMEMYAVFSSPVLYRVVQASGAEVGSIEQNFVDRLVEGMSSFLLGGRAWVVEAVNHKEKTVRVAKAPGGQKPTWGGALPQLLGHDVCQRVRTVLLSNATYPYLTPPASEALEEKRKEMRLTLGREGRAIQYSPGAAMWWTYAGGRINHTLKHGLEYIGGWKVVADNFSVRIKGDGIEPERVAAAIGTLGQEVFWKDERTWRDIIARLPAYRLSKFQQAMPDRCASEMIAAYLLDVGGMLRWLVR
ncbi:MAG: DEAD/DEAH box helicase, partial [Deltaproteobacteria bacterium]